MSKIRDGDLYQRFEIKGVTFGSYYGYSTDHWCYKCEMFDKREKYIGICRRELRKSHIQRKNEGNAGECIVR